MRIPTRVLARIQPVGTVVLAEATGPKGMMTGEQVYTTTCKTCHETGLAGAPKIGDKAAWGKIIAQGEWPPRSATPSPACVRCRRAAATAT